MAISSGLTAEQIGQVQALVDARNYGGAWAQLAQFGDAYADNAYDVVGRPDTPAGDFYGELVEQHWNNTAGEGAYEQYFDQVTELHLNNYIDQLNKTGEWPSTQFIESSYRNSVEFFGMPATTAFDAIFTQSIGDATQGYYDWWDALDMEEGRVEPSNVFDHIPFDEAVSTLANDILDTLTSLWEQGDLQQWSLAEWLGIDGFNQYMNQFIQDLDRDLDLDEFWGSLNGDINNILNDMNLTWDQFLDWVEPPPRRDPLALDLDGDGIETLAADGYSGVLFDQNGDGIKRATGWVASDDGLLVLDRNGNGTIDNGTELFGNNTPTADGTAADGLSALADLDTNLDGRIDASDAQFANLNVWRDLNSDGISQADELFTLNDLGITSLNTGGTLDVNTDLGNGNSVINEGTFTWSDGSQGDMADLALQEQDIYREFTDEVTLSAEIEALPDLVATGPVRDLREAMSLDTSGNLTTLVTQYSATTSRAGQLSLLDNLLLTWAESSGFETSPGEGWPVVKYQFDGIDEATQPEAYAAALDKIRVMETFNGQLFLTTP